MFAALAPIAAALISGAATYAGTQQTNAANTSQAYMQSANNWNMMEAQNNYNIAAFDRQKDFTRDQYQFELDNNRLNSAADFQRSLAMQDRSFDFGRAAQEDSQQFAMQQMMAQQNFERQNMNTAMNYNWQAADAQRRFTDFMASTSYQRAMGDMKLAGLNPILAYAQGGAPVGSAGQASIGTPAGSAPTGGMASGGGGGAPSTASAHGSTPGHGSVSTPQYQRAQLENQIGPAVSSAMQGARFLTELEGLHAQIARTNADTKVLNEQAHQVQANTALQVAQHASEGKRTELIGAQVASEQRRPGQIAAATEAAESSAVASRAAAGASTAAAGASSAQEGRTREETRQLIEYGRPGHLGSAASTVGQLMNRPEVGAALGGASNAVGAIRAWAEGAGGWIRRQLNESDQRINESIRRAQGVVR